MPVAADAVLQEGRDFKAIWGTPTVLPMASWPSVSAEYFPAMRIPLRAGRIFRNEGEVERVTVVSESAARLLWPGENPLGKRLSLPVSEDPATYWRVVGVV
jgi:putative ABC transport system permease protein